MNDRFHFNPKKMYEQDLNRARVQLIAFRGSFLVHCPLRGLYLGRPRNPETGDPLRTTRRRNEPRSAVHLR